MRFHIILFCTKASKFGVYLTLTAHLSWLVAAILDNSGLRGKSGQPPHLPLALTLTGEEVLLALSEDFSVWL